MAPPDGNTRQAILQLIRENPFVSQKDLALRLNISRSAVAAHISALIREGEIVGRAYVLPERRPVLCIGGANIDRKIQTMAPIQYGTSNPAFVSESHGGVARNVAENLARLGVLPVLVTMVGHDQEGDSLLERARQDGVDVSHAIRSGSGRTGTYTAVLDADGSLAVALADMAIYDEFTVQLLAPRLRLMRQSELTVLDTNLPAESLAHVIAEAASTGTRLLVVPVSVPKAMRLPHSLDGVWALIANRDEVAALSGVAVAGPEGLRQACAALRERGCRVVVVTLGQDGVAWMDASGRFGEMPADPVQVVDVTGAGDAFVAGFAFGMVHKLSVQQACRFAARLAQRTLLTQETVCPEITSRLAHTWLTEILSVD
ncbi:carbohydrate kinase [Alicyclobacillus macrosporangiidus]|uniref:carbohydrate kinase n=1 Tax=Alicyclobacillus macrosporangiidus TaxID=392015 RepID=UPI00069103C8|nr:carbohydrate kinase [Alicyclobacillus macrosporangiidus]